MDLTGLFSMLKNFRGAAEAFRRTSAEVAYRGRQPYPQASWQELSSHGEETLLPPVEELRADAERLLRALEALKEAFLSGERSQGQPASLVRDVKAFIDLCTALRERIIQPLPEAPLDAPYGAGAPKVPSPAASALVVAEAALRLADEVTSWFLWQANVARHSGA